MDIDIFAFSDFAEDISGKQIIVGVFDSIFANQLPAVHPQCTIAARIRFRSIEAGNHAFGIKILTPDGKPLIPPFNGNINFQPAPGIESGAANFHLNLQGLKFESFGRYSAILSVDGQELRTLPLLVSKMPQPQPNA